jgi:glycosyltransferase involved in cell wall biosynthesis
VFCELRLNRKAVVIYKYGSAIAMERNINQFKQTGSIDEPGDKRVSVLEVIGTATRGGMENYIAAFLKNLPPEQFRVNCICPCESPFTKTLREIGVEGVYITPIADNPDWRSVQMAMEVARLNEVDVFHAHMPKSHVLAGIAGSLLDKPVVATIHGMHVTAHELGVALAVKSHLVTNCQETWIQALALGIQPQRVNLFHNGVDINEYTPINHNKTLRNDLGLQDDITLVGFVGRLEYEKGPDLFLRAASVIHEVLPAVQFVMVGAGSMLESLKKMRKQWGLEQHLHFVDWSANTAEIYPSLDLLIHSSRNDGTSLVVLEAMACGKPVAGMAVGGVREMIENEYTGMQAEANDWEGLGNQVIKLLQQPPLLKSMGEAGRIRVEEKFDVAINSRKTADLLRRVAFSTVPQGNGNGYFNLLQFVNSK